MKDTSKDPVFCKDKKTEDCKLNDTKTKCPNLCKKIKEDPKNKGMIIVCCSGEASFIPLSF